MEHLQELINQKKDFGSGEQDFRPDMPQYSEEGIKKTNELLEVVSKIGEKHHATNAQNVTCLDD